VFGCCFTILDSDDLLIDLSPLLSLLTETFYFSRSLVLLFVLNSMTRVRITLSLLSLAATCMFSGLSFLTTSVFSSNSSIDDGLIMRTVFFSARTGSNCPFANSLSLKEEVS